MKTLLCLLLLFLISSFQQQQSLRQLIVGKWRFNKFQFPTYNPDSISVMRENASHQNMILKFTQDGNFYLLDANDLNAVSNQSVYKIIDQKRMLIIGNDTCEIHRLNKRILEIHSLGWTIMRFKRM